MTERKAKVVWSIRWIVTVAAVVLTAGAVVSVGAVAERNVRRALTAEIETRLLLDARTLSLASTGAMLGDYPELTLHPLAKELLARQPELNVIVVTDIRGVVQGHPDVRSLGQSYALPAGLKPIEDARRLKSTAIIEFRVEQEDTVYPMVPAGADLHAMIRRPSALVETAADE